MTDEMSAVLAGLTPTVVPVDGADPELIAIGERYWAMAGFHPELGTPVWCEKTADIDTLGWGVPLYVITAGGVRAVVDHTCPECQQQLSLTSRTALADLAKGERPVCVECTESLTSALQTLNDPKRKAKREAARARAAEQQALDTAAAAWRHAQREAMEDRYQLTFSETVPRASVREMVTALALLRYAPSTTPISAIGSWLDPLHPAQRETVRLLGALVRAGLIRIHPTTSVTAMEWEPASFQAALAAADGDPDSVHLSPQLTSQFFPLDSCFYAPFATSAGTGAQHLDTVLSERLAPQRLTAGQHNDLLALTQECIAEEALRYFTYRLEDLNLPAVTENHIERLREAAYKVARHRPLGEIYNLVWRSTRAAAESAQKNPRAPRVNISTHAVNQFETHALRAVTEPAWPIKAFGEVTGCGLSAMTRTLFYTVLDLQPLETSFCDIEQGLPQPASDPEPPVSETGVQPDEAGVPDDDDELAFFIRWLHTYPGSWDPEAVFRCLDDLEQTAAGMEYDVEQRVARRAVAHLKLLHERLAVVLDPRQAALAVVAATDLLQHPVTGRDPESMRPIGAVVRQRLVETVLQTMPEASADE
ncbi:hypothetical protein SAM9427_36440 (plasmid) [Streptomyces sp. ETH9427]|uniref:hypothetical protein n=1 Tax=Streptomyces sp. E1N211 TaxID=1851876 RepID=UPI000E0A43CF|nr:hypothetical protein [Streptomyces sp. E1N211]AXI91259.1 hypothetical protein SAM9427_36440 [Streptomyces sp. ETH9427]